MPLVETTLKIAAKDGSFVFNPNEKSPVPFASDCPESPNPQQVGYVAGQAYEMQNRNAKVVLVYLPGEKIPIEGLLAFCGVWTDYQGPVASSYLIKIPDAYVQAMGGAEGSGATADFGKLVQSWREVVVFEDYAGPSDKKVPAWILWLSRLGRY